MLGKLLLLALALAGAYFLFFLPPQQPPQEQGANPVQPADPACPQKLADLKQFAAQNNSCQTWDDCVEASVGRDLGESGCELLFDTVVNIDQAPVLDRKADEFFDAGCGLRAEYCPPSHPYDYTPKCVNNQCVLQK